MNDCKILFDHYQKGICKSTYYIVQILEVLTKHTSAIVHQEKQTK